MLRYDQSLLYVVYLRGASMLTPVFRFPHPRLVAGWQPPADPEPRD